MTREAFILHDALDYIDTATHKAALALEYVADYFDPDPIDHDRIRAEQAAIRTLVNISLDYLTKIKREYAEAMNRTAHTADPADHDSTEDSSPSTNAAHKPAEQAPDTNGKSAAHTPSAAPMTAEQAAERIQYISLDEAMTETAHAYRAAILQWVDDNEPETPGHYITFALAFAAGVQEGKRMEREARRNRQSKPET